jgi:hypothetical protein
MSHHVTPTPRDQRIVVLSAMRRRELIDRADALGWDTIRSGECAPSNDELIAMILDAEQQLGVTSR